jgi:hypothetical protein
MILLVIEYFASFCNTSVIIVITSTNIGLRYDRWRMVVHILLVSCISFVVTTTKTKIKSFLCADDDSLSVEGRNQHVVVSK